MTCGYFDGASRGNPGEAGAGACLIDEGGGLLWECAEYLGEKTNNEAEYEALILLLEEMRRRGIEGIRVYGDSRLVINQVLGTWKIREPRLKPLAERAKELVAALQAKPRWVPRSENLVADDLSNKAIDESGKPTALESDGMQAKRVARDIFVVNDGKQQYAVDLAHDSCTCGDFRRHGKCVHLEATLRSVRGK